MHPSWSFLKNYTLPPPMSMNTLGGTFMKSKFDAFLELAMSSYNSFCFPSTLHLKHMLLIFKLNFILFEDVSQSFAASLETVKNSPFTKPGLGVAALESFQVKKILCECHADGRLR